MAFHLYENVWETSTTTGTGTYSLGGAVSGWRTFSSQYSNGDTCWYSAYDGTNFENGIGTYGSSGDTLARTTIYRSTNSNSAVSWGAGTKNITVTPIGVAMESFFTIGDTGYPYRNSDNSWSYSTSVPNTALPLATSSTTGIVQPDNSTITINGSGVISAAGGSALTLISTLTANNSAGTLSWTGLSTYSNYLLVIDSLISASGSNQTLYVQYGIGATPTWASGASYICGGGYYNDNSNTWTGFSNSSADGIDLGSGTEFGSSSYGCQAVVNINNATYTGSSHGGFTANYYHANVSNINYYGFVTGIFSNGAAITGIRIILGSGNLNSGFASLYGYST